MSLFSWILKSFRPVVSSYPRLNALVRFKKNSPTHAAISNKGTGSLMEVMMSSEGTYIYLGEIVNMPGHGIFVGCTSGKTYFGYHPDEFEEIPEEEV